MNHIDSIVDEYFDGQETFSVAGGNPYRKRAMTDHQFRAALVLAAEGEWVNVEDGLPELNVPVLAQFQYAHLVVKYNGRNWIDTEDRGEIYCAPIKWQSLPTPPGPAKEL